MEPVTETPWEWSEEKRRLDHEYYKALARERASKRASQRSRLTIYTYGSDAPVLRIGGWNGRANTERPLENWERYPLDQFSVDRYPLHLSPPVPRLPPDLTELRRQIELEWAPHAPATPLLWAAVCAVFAALLAVLLLLTRVIERCRDLNLLKRRQRSQEWITASVRATRNRMIHDGTVIIPGLENAEPLPADLNEAVVDFPPPYSTCTEPGGRRVSAPGTIAHNKMSSNVLHGDLPPPYSDCYVEFANKRGAPSVLIFSRQRTPLLNRREIANIEQLAVMSTDDGATNSYLNTGNNKTNDGADNNETVTDHNSMPINAILNCEADNNGSASSSGATIDVDDGDIRKGTEVLMHKQVQSKY